MPIFFWSGSSPVIEYELRETLLTVDGISVALGGKPVLKDLAFIVRNVYRPDRNQGQVVALLGPSGIGKTTLFRVLAGLNPPDKGHVLIGPKQKPVEAGDVGIVFQQYRLFEHRSVVGNLMVAARRVGLKGSKARSRAIKLLEQFGIGELQRRYPAQLSGGQRQRVAIAQQFLCSHYFLLMDEPFSGLDPLAIDRVCDLVAEASTLDELNTIIIVTHNIEAGLKVADTVLLLGRDRDASGGIISGAKIQQTYDLMKMGLAWRKGIDTEPKFVELEQEIKARFRDL